MNPKHQTVSDPTRKAHAPYNFVPLPEKVVAVTSIPAQDSYSHFTGILECTVETLTPLYTRSVMSPEFFAEAGDKAFHELTDHQKAIRAEFYSTSTTKRPMIPGSSLRGMTRTLVEIIGFGKMQWVTNEPLIYRAVGDRSSLGEHYRRQLLGTNKTSPPNTHLNYPSSQVRGGYLKRYGSGWAITQAKVHSGETFVHVEYTDADPITRHHYGRQVVHDVYVVPASRKTTNRGKRGPGDLILDVALTSRVVARATGGTPPLGMVSAVLVESGHMGSRDHPKHWHCAIYEPDSTASVIPIPDALWQVYANDRDETRGLPTRKLQNDGDALFYLLDDKGTLVFFGPTMMFRLPYPHLPRRDLVPATLQIEQQNDLAEAIFGFTKSADVPADQRACAGRVSFSDALCDPTCANPWLAEQAITPKILGSPKPTSFQHYLTQQEPDDRRRLDHYASSPPHDTVIRGHKLYWHKQGTDSTEIEEADRDKIEKAPKQYARIKPVRTGVSFRFRVNFENLRDYELGALLWALTLPSEAGRTYRHKLGMGKPLGMGSTAIAVCLHLSERTPLTEAVAGDVDSSRYGRLFTDSVWHEAITSVEDTTTYLKAFQDYVLSRLDPAEKGRAQTLHEVYRVKTLLAMLEWPGPNPRNTTYMQIDSFRDRLVLPDPLAILSGKPVQPPTSMHQTAVRPQQPPVVKAVPVTVPAAQLPPKPQSAPEASPAPTSPTSPPKPLPKPQPIREVTVVQAAASFVTVELDGEQINIPLDQLAEPGRDQRDRSRLYPARSKLEVRDLGLSSKGRRRLTTKL